MNRDRFSIPWLLAGFFVLAGCLAIPETARQPGIAPTGTSTPTELRLEHSPSATETEILPAYPAVPTTGVPTATPTPTYDAAAYTLPPPPPPTPTELPSQQPPLPGPIPLLPAGQPVRINRIHMIDSRTGWGIGGMEEDAGHVLRTVDGGRSWQDVTPPELASSEDQNFKQAAGYFLDAAIAWVVFYSPSPIYMPPSPPDGVWHTRDGGQTWQLSRFPQTNSDLFGGSSVHEPEFTFIDAQHGWLLLETHIGMGSFADALYRTGDSGQSWQLVTVETHVANNGGMDFFDLQHGWVPDYFDFGVYPPMELFHTEDGGLTWESIALPFPDGAYTYAETTVPYSECAVTSPALRSPQAGRLVVSCHLLGVTNNDHFLYTTLDGGQTWQITPLPGYPEFISDSTGWTLGQASSENQAGDKPQARVLYHTQDGGQTWEEITTVDWFGQLHFINQQAGWAIVSTDEENYLMQTSDGGKNWVRVDPQTIPGEGPASRRDPPRISLPARLLPLEPGNLNLLQVLDEVPGGNTTDLAFDNDGDTLAVAQRDGSVLLWGVRGEPYPRVVPRHSDWVYDIDFSFDGYWFATASKDGMVRLNAMYPSPWVIRDLSPLADQAGEVTSSAFVDLATLATGSSDGNVNIWDISGAFDSADPADTNISLLSTLKGHTGWVWDVAVSPDRQTLASASDDETIRLWNVESGETMQTLRGHSGTVWRVAFSPDGTFLASASWDATVKFWDPVSGEALRTLQGHRDWILAMAFSPDGKSLATGSRDGLVILWETESGKMLHTLDEHDAAVRGLSFSPDGRLLATASEDGILLLWGVTP